MMKTIRCGDSGAVIFRLIFRMIRMSIQARPVLADGLAPIYAVLSAPLGLIHATIAETTALCNLRADND